MDHVYHVMHDWLKRLACDLYSLRYIMQRNGVSTNLCVKIFSIKSDVFKLLVSAPIVTNMSKNFCCTNLVTSSMISINRKTSHKFLAL